METRQERRVMNLMKIEEGMSVKAISERLIIPHDELSIVLKNLQKQHKVKVTHNGLRVRLPIKSRKDKGNKKRKNSVPSKGGKSHPPLNEHKAK